MRDCEAIRPLLFNAPDGELNPKETMQVARHLADCTACKIIDARERRLARMLEVDLQDIPVGDDFFRSVMASLPADPPPAENKKKRRHGLRLAGLGGFLAAGALLASRLTPVGGYYRSATSIPALDFESSQGGFEGLLDLVRMVVMSLRTVAASVDIDAPLFSGNYELMGGIALLVLLTFGTGSALFALIARCWVWPGR
jgi:anti-sigma factor RsiW